MDLNDNMEMEMQFRMILKKLISHLLYSEDLVGIYEIAEIPQLGFRIS